MRVRFWRVEVCASRDLLCELRFVRARHSNGISFRPCTKQTDSYMRSTLSVMLDNKPSLHNVLHACSGSNRRQLSVMQMSSSFRKLEMTGQNCLLTRSEPGNAAG